MVRLQQEKQAAVTTDPMGWRMVKRGRMDWQNHPASEDQMIKLDRTDTPAAAEHATVYLAFELSKAKWKLAVLMPGSQERSSTSVLCCTS